LAILSTNGRLRSCTSLFGGFLGINRDLLAHGGKNNDSEILALFGEQALDLVAELTIWDLDVVLGGAVVGEEGEETIVGDIEQLVFLTTDVGHIHVVGGRAEIFELLAGEDVDCDQVDLCVTVFASLGSGHFDNLAGTVLDHDVTVLAKGRALHGVGGRGTGIGALKGVLMLRIVVGHDDK